MGKNRTIPKSFCYSIDDISVIEEIERIAKDDGVSFSQVIMQQLKDLVHQKKAFEAAKQQRTVCYDITASTVAVQQSQEQEQEQEQPSNNNYNDDPSLPITITNPANVLDLIRDNRVIGMLYWNQALEQVDDVEHLQKCITFGNTLRMAASERLNVVKAQKLIESKARSRNGVSA